MSGLHAPRTAFDPVQIGEAFKAEDRVRTLASSRAAVRFTDGVLVRLNELSTLQFHADSSNQRSTTLSTGTAYFFSREPRHFPVVETPLVSAAVRGTEFVVAVDAGQTTVSVLEGEVDCSNSFGSVRITSGEEAVTRPGQAPVKRVLIQPNDAVQWALYYPAVLDLADLPEFLPGSSTQQQQGWKALIDNQLPVARAAFSGTDWRDHLGRAILAYRDGAFTEASLELAAIKEPHNASVNLFESGLALAVGQVSRSSSTLAQCERGFATLPSEQRALLQSGLLAQRAIVALTLNHKEEARALVTQALQAHRSASALLAQSYVAQASFDLPGARESLEQARATAPTNVLLAARLAEIELGAGDLRAARTITDEAMKLGIDDAYLYTVSGFSKLAEYDARGAQQDFARAMAIDSAMGLAHLGSGLARIRLGELSEGRREIESAVNLEPNVSLFRSYLGKAYYEEERGASAAREFARAAALDPNDPTPHLYSAFQKLSSYEPIAALTEITTSIDLNDNRAVYRSSLLLDQDRSVRGAGLSQVFSALGFQELGRLEAIKSLNQDYSNYSAHLLLSDAYVGLPSFTGTSSNELLIARLLEPVNYNSAISSGGAQASLNEYTSLFDRPIHRNKFESLGDTLDRYGLGRLVDIGTFGSFGYALAYRSEYADGFRRNDFLKTNNLAATAQYEISPFDTLILDNVIAFTSNGDRSLNFDPRTNDDTRDQDLDIFFSRAGFRHQIGPRSVFIGQVGFEHSRSRLKEAALPLRIRDVTLQEQGPPTFRDLLLDAQQFAVNRDDQGRADVQLIHDSELVSLVGGGSFLRGHSYSHGDLETRPSAEMTAAGDFGLLSKTASSIDEQAERAYLYSTWHVASWADLTAGASYGHLKFGEDSSIAPFTGGTRTLSQWSPKFGTTLNVGPHTTLRAGYWKSLGETTVGELGNIEPTLVGGFNQTLYSLVGGRDENFSVGLDHRIGAHTYLGTEFFHRHVSQELPTSGLAIIRNADGQVLGSLPTSASFDERSSTFGVSSYWYQVLSDRMTGSVEHLFTHLDSGESFTPSSDTQRIRAAVNYFAKSGWFFFSALTWRDQQRETFLNLSDTYQHFWLLDGGAGYQLPDRHGVIRLALTNILDEDFKYVNTGREANIFPDIGAVLSINVNF